MKRVNNPGEGRGDLIIDMTVREYREGSNILELMQIIEGANLGS